MRPHHDSELSSPTLDQIEIARSRLRSTYLFPPQLEVQFRRWQDQRFSLPRTILFGVIAAAMFSVPLLQMAIFEPVAEIIPWLLLIQLGWVGPVCLLTAWATYRQWPKPVVYHLQTAAVLSTWAGILAFTIFSHLELMSFPNAMLGISVTAVAALGGFKTRRLLIGATLTFGISTWIKLAIHGAEMTTYQVMFENFFFMFVTAGTGIALDVLARNFWINHRYAEALRRTDALTRVMSRAAFDEIYPRVVRIAIRDGRSVAVAVLDLDHFKSINDQHGHMEGDRALRQAASSIGPLTARRPLDLCARFGGEEFVLVWYDTTEEDLPMLLEGTLHLLREVWVPPRSGGLPNHLTGSIGAVIAWPKQVHDGTAMLARADALLYDAKHQGRDRYLLERLDLRAPTGRPGAEASAAQLTQG
jgi:diguanylate cyclase (GGDEF)-like protein